MRNLYDKQDLPALIGRGISDGALIKIGTLLKCWKVADIIAARREIEKNRVTPGLYLPSPDPDWLTARVRAVLVIILCVLLAAEIVWLWAGRCA